MFFYFVFYNKVSLKLIKKANYCQRKDLKKALISNNNR